MLFDDIYWHDGQIRGLSLEYIEGMKMPYLFVLKADVYMNDEYINSEIKIHRTKITVNFSNVVSFVISGNIMEMIENFNAGNISTAYRKGKGAIKNKIYKNEKYRYIFNLFGGYVEICAKDIEIERAES